MTTATSSQPLEEAAEIITTFPNYGLTWLAYTGLTLLMVAIIWWGFRKRHFIINWFIASVILAGALTPGRPIENTETYSPLVLSAVVDLFDDKKAGFFSALTTIGLVWLVLFVIGLGVWFGFKQFVKSKNSDKSKAKTAKTETKKEAMATPIEPVMSSENPQPEHLDNQNKEQPLLPTVFKKGAALQHLFWF